MILSSEEAICLVLNCSKDHTINSLMKLNKMVARLNLHFIPIDIDFSLNKWGSFNADLRELQTNEYFEKSYYKYQGKEIPIFKLKEEGKKLAQKTIQFKIKNILKTEEINRLIEDLYERSTIKSEELAEEEHKELLVDEEDRSKLIQRINLVSVELFDLYQKINSIPEDTIENIRLAALIEYCYNLAKFLKELRFKEIEVKGYDFDAYMFDYYFLYLLDTEVIPLIKKQITKTDKDGIILNKYYQYFVNSVKERYPFSLDNPNLFKLIAR